MLRGEPHDVRRCRPEREPDADLPPTLVHDPRQNAIGADAAERYAEKTESAGDPGERAMGEKAERQTLFQRLEVIDDDIGIDRTQPRPDERRGFCGLETRLDEK